MDRIVIATGNAGKYEEILNIMTGLEISWVWGWDGYQDEIEETGSSYYENACIKGTIYSQVMNLPALADDSGLEVDVLNGAPGLKSNRFFGDGLKDSEKIVRLLELMNGVERSKRTARFRCCAVLILGNEVIFHSEGRVEGIILESPVGSGGFGYDPIFWIPEKSCTMAELTSDEKCQISHRGRAMRSLRDFLLRN